MLSAGPSEWAMWCLWCTASRVPSTPKATALLKTVRFPHTRKGPMKEGIRTSRARTPIINSQHHNHLPFFGQTSHFHPPGSRAHRLHMQGLQGRQLWGANPPLGEGRRGYPPHHTLPERPGWSHYQQHLWKRYGLHRRLGFSDLSSFIYHLVLRDLAWNTSHVLVSVRKARANTHRRNAINLPVQLWILPVRYHILNENCVSHKFSWCNKAV